MHQVEPFYGWEKYYLNAQDERSPFFGVEYNQAYYDRQVYQYLAHPQWDEIGSESLLVKIIFADYEHQYAVIEVFGVWNDLLINDFNLLLNACLEPLLSEGISKIILVMENVLNIYLEHDDYYESFQEELSDGWVCILRAREHVIREMEENGISQYFFWSEFLDELNWRKLKPSELLRLIEARMEMYLP